MIRLKILYLQNYIVFEFFGERKADLARVWPDTSNIVEMRQRFLRECDLVIAHLMHLNVHCNRG